MLDSQSAYGTGHRLSNALFSDAESKLHTKCQRWLAQVAEKIYIYFGERLETRRGVVSTQRQRWGSGMARLTTCAAPTPAAPHKLDVICYNGSGFESRAACGTIGVKEESAG